MDHNTVKVLSSNIFRSVDSERRKLKLPENYYIENTDLLKDYVMETLGKLGVTFDSDDVELVAKEVQYTMSIWMGDDEEEGDELFEMDLWLGNLDGVKLEVQDLFSGWDSILARKDIAQHKEEIIADFNGLLEEIYARKLELEEL